MNAPPESPSGPQRPIGMLANNIVHFARTLRTAGLRVGPGQVLRAVEAVETVPGETPPVPAIDEDAPVVSVILVRAKRRIVLPESQDARVRQAAAALHAQGLCTPVLVDGGHMGSAPPGVEIVRPSRDPRLSKLAETLFELRRHKGLTLEEARERVLARMPQRRLIRPEEVAEAIVYLMSEAAAGVNGAALPLDGGELAS